MALRSEAGAGRASSLRRNPAKCQHLRDLGADQRGAKIRAPPRPGKPPQLQGGNQGADLKNWRRRKRRASRRSPQKRSSDHPCHLLPPRGAAFFWDWTASLRSRRPPLPPGPLTRLWPANPTCALPTAHYTAHQPLQGPCGPNGEQFSSGLSLQRPFPPPPCAHSPALLDKANVPLSRTLPLLRPYPLGGDIAVWALGLGAPFSAPFSLLASHRGAWEGSPGLKGSTPHLILTCPTGPALAGVANGEGVLCPQPN